MFDFGLHLKTLRKNNGLTQRQLAAKLHVSETAVIRWENNYMLPGLDNLRLLGKLYHVPLDYLAGTDRRNAVLVEDLTPQQVSLLHTLILEFQSPKEKTKGGLSPRQQEILSAVMAAYNG